MKVKKGTQVYTGITQTDAANLAKELYSKNLNFQSDLINSYTWDTAIVFIQTFSEDSDYSKESGVNTEVGKLLTGESILKSDNNTDKRCNIYDMAGNVLEWSTETCTDRDNPCVDRGGHYDNGSLYTARRYNIYTSYSDDYISFRTILYL